MNTHLFLSTNSNKFDSTLSHLELLKKGIINIYEGTSHSFGTSFLPIQIPL